MIFVGVSEVREVMNFEYKNNNFDNQEFFHFSQFSLIYWSHIVKTTINRAA